MLFYFKVELMGEKIEDSEGRRVRRVKARDE